MPNSSNRYTPLRGSRRLPPPPYGCRQKVLHLHKIMAQLMPLTLTVSCFSKIQTGFTFLVPAHPVVLDKGLLNGCVCNMSTCLGCLVFRFSYFCLQQQFLVIYLVFNAAISVTAVNMKTGSMIQLTKKGPLNGRVCVCVCVQIKLF